MSSLLSYHQLINPQGSQRRLRIVYAGTPEFALPALTALVKAAEYDVVAVYTQPDKPAGRGQTLTQSVIKNYALNQNIPVEQPQDLRDEIVLQQLKSYLADLMIVAAYGLILPQTVLDVFPLGCLNIHASLLPRWRGAAPIQYAIKEGDLKSGITIMQMTLGLDAGAILHQAECEITPHMRSCDLHDILAELGKKTLLNCLANLRSNKIIPKSQCSDLVTYAPKILKSDAQLNWQESAVVLDRKIRAFYPWPGAFTYAENHERIRVHEARILSKNEISALHDEKISLSPGLISPGFIQHVHADGVDVMTSKGLLRLQKLQFSGAKPLTIREILNGKPTRFQVGQCFYSRVEQS